MKKSFKFLGIGLIGLTPCFLSAQIITVTGAIEPKEMGLALVHEHIMVDWIGADSTGYHRWNRDEIVKIALPYLQELEKLGIAKLHLISQELYPKQED